MNSALTEDRLDHDSRHLTWVHLLHQEVVLEVVEHRGVVERSWSLRKRRPEPVRERDRDHSCDVLRAANSDVRKVTAGDGRQVGRLTVVLPTESQDQRAPSGFTHELDGAFDRQRSGDRVLDAAESSRRDVGQELSKLEHWSVLDPRTDLHAVPVPRFVHGRLDPRRSGTERRSTPR